MRSLNEDFIFFASVGDYYDVKRLLCDESVDPSYLDNKAIRLASFHGYYDVVELLLNDNRVDPTAENNEAIRGAICNNRKKTVELLLGDKRVQCSLKSLPQHTKNIINNYIEKHHLVPL